jgi:hypothetical protein
MAGHRNRLAVGLLALALAGAAGAQQGYPVYVANSAPSGACVGPRVWLSDTNPSVTYCCISSVWVSCTGGGGGAYTLPIASASVLGGVKVGSGLAIDVTGVLSTSGGVTPGGSNTYVQFNDSGAFGGDAGFTYTKATKTVTMSTASGSDGLSFTTAGARLRLGPGTNAYLYSNAAGDTIMAPYRFGASAIDLYLGGVAAGSMQMTGGAGTYQINMGAAKGVLSSMFQSSAAGTQIAFLLAQSARVHFNSGTGNDYLTSLAGTGISTPSSIAATGGFIGNASTATALSTTGTSGQFWSYNNTWATPAGGGGGSSVWVDAEIPSGLINGSNVTYTLGSTPSPSTSLRLYANGVRLRPTTDYSLATATITMVAPLQTGDWFYADYRTTTVGNNVDAEIPSGAINGSNTAFTLANAAVPSTTLHVYLNGVRLRPTSDYTISGTSLTMVMVPQTGDWLYADYRY